MMAPKMAQKMILVLPAVKPVDSTELSFRWQQTAEHDLDLKTREMLENQGLNPHKAFLQLYVNLIRQGENKVHCLTLTLPRNEVQRTP